MLNASQLLHELDSLQLLNSTIFFLGVVILFKLMYKATAKNYLMSIAIIITMLCLYMKSNVVGFTDIVLHGLVLYMYLRRFLSVQHIEQSLKEAELFNRPTISFTTQLSVGRKEVALVEHKLNRWFWTGVIIKVVLIIMEY